jgi:prepilin-type N-terminal cleavage/methylation domain-containing protein
MEVGEYMLKKELKNKGFSLIELLVSASLLLILAVGFIPLLTNSYTSIFSTGEKNNAVNLAQKEIEQWFSTGTTYDTDILFINFIDVDTTTVFEIEGEKVQINKPYDNGKTISFEVFIPKQ